MSAVPSGPPPGPPPAPAPGPASAPASASVPARPPGPPPGVPVGQSFRPPAFGFPPAPMMGMPPGMPNFPPPLPAGWSEHRAPDGVTPYYYNTQTRESTYIRPTIFPPFAPTNAILSPHAPSTTPPIDKEKKKKKEKPKDKVPIPGTTWTRVTTNEGNVFYFEKESKKSEWTVPDEIKDQVVALEAEERAVREAKEKEEREKAEQDRLEKLREIERIRMEIEEEKRKRAAEAERKRKERDDNAEADAAESQDIRETKIARRDGEEQVAENGENGENGEGEEEGGEYGPEDEEDEAEWMKAVAAEFAEADKAMEEEKQKTAEEIKAEEEEAAKKVFAVPAKVQVSADEGRALFKALLIEKDINPFSPWDQSLPLFINDPRYVLLSSEKDRKEVYEEYCRDVGRARRLAKASGGGAKAESSKKADPERDYKSLLREEVTSTRTRWDDFRKKWKKERRFYAFGRDDREREKVFKTHLRELGERKRADAQRAEQDFYDLLKESDNITSSSIWSEVKRPLSSDPRYDAIGSSSLREELFNTYTRKLASSSSQTDESKEDAAARKLTERKARQEQSLKEREAKIREEKERVQMETNRSRVGAGREEAERLFGSLLVDQIRDHNTTWEEASAYLSNDPRFNHPSLGPRDKARLFSEHISRIASKRSNALHQLFEAHTPSLDTPYDSVYPHIVDDQLIKRLGLQGEALEDRWKAWMRTRESNARSEFDQMLGENSFVEFWGKMRKKTLDENALAVKRDDQFEEAEGIDVPGEEANDITKLARQIDLGEIKSVLRRDKRYRQFDHIPEKREQWLRDYLENLEAASGSRTIHNVGLKSGR
ncbi:transcription elongation regulator 1 [Kwoniella heveanensis CBS 569]|nr:transcription elongation regulator 1 [Kwoniella heveanensis CBS 569]